MGVSETGVPQTEYGEGMNRHRTVNSLGQAAADANLGGLGTNGDVELYNPKTMGVLETGVPQSE